MVKIKGKSTCINCHKETPVEIDLEKFDPKDSAPQMTEITTTNPGGSQTVQEVKPIEKTITKIKEVIPEYQPGYKCKGKECGEIHKNKNYTRLVKGKCSNCDQFSKDSSGECSWCRKRGVIEEISKEDLEEMDIPMPKEHDPDNDQEDHDH